MKLSTDNLTLALDAAIDLQIHTHFSDGVWHPEALLDYLKQENFGLVAITDHDSVESAIQLQKIAIEKQMPVLIAAEMTAKWRGQLTDILCYGFDPDKNALKTLAKEVLQRQIANTRLVFENLRKQDIHFQEQDIITITEKPSSAQPKAIFDLLMQHEYGTEAIPTGRLMREAGFEWATHDVGKIVAAAHEDDGVALIAHPGRDDGFVCYDADLLDELRADVPIDGLEVYYPRHSDEQTEMFRAYADRHDLLISSGSDSHAPDKKPVKYPADFSQKLLERTGISIS